MSVNKRAKSGSILGNNFDFFNMKVCCVFSLESPHRGYSHENTQYTIFNIKKNTILNPPKSAAKRFFLGTQERVRNSRGKRAISVRATEVLLYLSSEHYLAAGFKPKNCLYTLLMAEKSSIL